MRECDLFVDPSAKSCRIRELLNANTYFFSPQVDADYYHTKKDKEEQSIGADGDVWYSP